MRTAGFNCAWYWPPMAKRVVILATLIIVVVTLGAVATGHGGTMLIMLLVSLVTATVGEAVRAGLRCRRRTT